MYYSFCLESPIVGQHWKSGTIWQTTWWRLQNVCGDRWEWNPTVMLIQTRTSMKFVHHEALLVFISRHTIICPSFFKFHISLLNFTFHISYFAVQISYPTFPISHIGFPISCITFPSLHFPCYISHFTFPISSYTLHLFTLLISLIGLLAQYEQMIIINNTTLTQLGWKLELMSLSPPCLYL